MSDPTVSGSGKTTTYTPPPSDESGKAPQVDATAGTQNDSDLTVSRQSDQLAAAQTAGLVTADDLQPPKTLGDLALAVSVLFADLTQTQAKNTEDMLDDTGKKIQENNHKRLEQAAKMEKLLEQHKKKQSGILAGEICGIIGGALVAGLSLGTLGPVGATMMVASVALATATQVTQMTGGFDKLAKSDPQAAQGLMYGMLATSVLLAVGTGGASLASSFSSAGEAAAMAGETAAETGAAMSEATTSAEAADTLMEGVSEMSTTLETTGTDSAEAGANVAEASADTAEAPAAFSENAGDAGDIAGSGDDAAEIGDADDVAAEASDAGTDVDETKEGVDETGDVAANAKPEANVEEPEESDEGVETTTEEDGESRLQKAAKIGGRAGRALEFASDVQEGETKIELGINEKQQHDVQSAVMKLDADTQNERSIQKEIADAAEDIIETLNTAFKFMGDHEQTLNKTRTTSISAIGQAATEPA